MLDKSNGNTLWSDYITKEMTNAKVEFKILDDNESIPRNHQFVKCHMIFDVKMDNFRRNERPIAGGYLTKAPVAVTYASVVSRETVRIALNIAALNDLQVNCGNDLNAYITAPVIELICTTLWNELGDYQGRTEIVVRALYGLKSDGATFRNHLWGRMSGIGYKPCLADPDIWLKPELRDDGFKYYS